MPNLKKEEILEIIVSHPQDFTRSAFENDLLLDELDFSSLTFENLDFYNIDFTSSNFSESNLTTIDFSNCNLTSTIFTRANIVECDFTNTILSNADFSYSYLSFNTFQNTDMTGVNLIGADLSNSDLCACENLSSAKFDETTIWPDCENLPSDFDCSFVNDLANLQDEEESVSNESY